MPDHAKFCSNCGAGLSDSIQKAHRVVIASEQPIDTSKPLESDVSALEASEVEQDIKELPAIADNRFTLFGSYQVKLSHTLMIKKMLTESLAQDEKKLM
jgi:hypothetical protein